MFLTNPFFQPSNSNFCSSENSTLLPRRAASRLNKRLTALSFDSSTEGDPCLLGETLHLWFSRSSSAVSSRLSKEQHPRRFQVKLLPKFRPTDTKISDAPTRARFQRLMSKRVSSNHFSRTRFQCFLSDPPLSSFKKLIILTPRLVQGLRTMSLAKAVPKGIRDKECKRFTLQERPLVPYVPEKNPVQETVSALKSQDYHQGRCGTTSPHLALWNAQGFSHACEFSP